MTDLDKAISGLETLKYQCKYNGECGTCNICYSAIPLAIQALEENQQYKAIGTIDEFKALKEKSVAKKPIQDEHFQYDYSCPCCGGKLAESVDDNCCLEEEMAGWCPYCGQKLDWQ